MKIFLPIHLDGGNRGCEAITKATALLLNLPKERIVALTRNIDLDNKLQLNNYVHLDSSKKESLFFRIKRKIRTFFIKDEYLRKTNTYQYFYNHFLNKITSEDIMLSTGGDMFCYDNNEVIYTNEYIQKQNVKSILWGCSIGERNLTLEKLNTLNHFTLIYVRESLTQKMLLDKGFKNVMMYPDPAFLLQSEECKLPDCFDSCANIVGINISNYVLGGWDLNTPFGKEVITLINYILNETNFNILLIPHVFWKDQDDRIVASNIVDFFDKNERISILDAERFNYNEIRYIISKCRFFIGARTHAVISAYSMFIPTIALGYSVKAKGIAKDLNLPDYLVIDSKNQKEKNSIVNSFMNLLENELVIKKHLENIIPDYTNKIFELRQIIFNIKK